jgi:hypothetical protein
MRGRAAYELWGSRRIGRIENPEQEQRNEQ